MKFKIFIILFIIPAILLAQEKIYEDGRGFIKEAEFKYDIEPGGEFIADVEGSDLFIRCGKNDEILIKVVKRIDVFSKEDAERAFEMAEVKIDKKDNNIYVEDRNYWRDRRSSVSIDFYIWVPKQFNFDFNTSGGDVRISDNITGNIRMRSSGGDLNARNITGDLYFDTSGGDIDMYNLKGNLDGHTSGGDFEIREIDGEVDIRTSGGDIDFHKLSKGGRISTSGGDIEIRETYGKFNGSTSGGDIKLDRIYGDIDLSSSGGDINLGIAQGNLRLSTSGGDMVIRGAYGSVDAYSSGGNVDIELMSEKDPRLKKDIPYETGSVRKRVKVEAKGGEIFIYLPEDINADIKARIRFSSRYENTSYDIDSDFPLVFSRDYRYKVAKGKLNKGGLPIILKTFNENIYIRKAR